MALFQRIVAASQDAVYMLEQYSSSTELTTHDRVTGEFTGSYEVIDFAQPRVGETWHLRLTGGTEIDTAVLHGVRHDQYSPYVASWCGPEELDRYAVGNNVA